MTVENEVLSIMNEKWCAILYYDCEIIGILKFIFHDLIHLSKNFHFKKIAYR